MKSTLKIEMLSKLQACKEAARSLRSLSGKVRTEVLLKIAQRLDREESALLLANQEDLKALPSNATPAFRDRLMLNAERLMQAGQSLRAVAAQPDPIGEITEQKILKNGLQLRRVRGPLGVILMIFESRPNVAIEAFSLALKSGNVILLRGGKESMRTTARLYALFAEALKEVGLPEDSFWGIETADRGLVLDLLQQNKFIDVVVPRGGDQLINFVVTHSRIPIIKNDRGMCHVYVHEDADLVMAAEIVANAKTQRPGVCNAMETLLVHRKVAPAFIPALYEKLSKQSLEWHACPDTLALLLHRERVHPAQKESWDTEYLDLKMNCRIVENLDAAIGHIEAHGSHHSESIVTKSSAAAQKFQNEVDAAAVYWNASTRFTDGFEFGLGGELGISTQKLHVRGPVGLKELTTVRWIIDGTGQVR